VRTCETLLAGVVVAGKWAGRAIYVPEAAPYPQGRHVDESRMYWHRPNIPVICAMTNVHGVHVQD